MFIIRQPTRFEQFFQRNYTPDLIEDMGRLDEQKWSLLEQLCSRCGLNVKDIGSIARYDTETVKFLSELPDEKLLKLQAFIRMKKTHFEYFQAVDSDTLKVLSEMKQSQLDFVKKYLQIENRGFQVFNNKQIVALAKHGCNEQQINRLIFDGGLYGESIMEAITVKDLNIEKLIQEINKAKKAYGKNFKRAHVLHNDYNPHSFSLGIVDDNGIAYLKTFDKDFNIINEEQLFLENIKNGQMSISRAGTQNVARREELQALLDDENTIVTFKRISKKGNLQSDVTLQANWTESRKLPIHAVLKKSQVVSEEMSFIGKNGEPLVETMVPSEVEGIYRIVQKAPNGAVKVLGDAKIDPKTGIKTITKNMESLNGTTTNKVITIENHSVIGGLGSAVCEFLSERYPTKVKRIGINDEFGQSGTAKELMAFYGLNAEKRLSGRYETIMWFTKGKNYDFDLDSIRIPQKYPGKKYSKGLKAGQFSGNILGKNPSDVWDIPNVKANHIEKTEHPCQFPIAIPQRLIKALTKPGSVIMDPFLGSGTTAIACIIEKRNFIGCELKKEYIEIAKHRIQDALAGKIKCRPDVPVKEPDIRQKVAQKPEGFKW